MQFLAYAGIVMSFEGFSDKRLVIWGDYQDGKTNSININIFVSIDREEKKGERGAKKKWRRSRSNVICQVNIDLYFIWLLWMLATTVVP